VKASDIPEALIHDVIASGSEYRGHHSATTFDFYNALSPEYPRKVVLARLRALVKSGKISAQCTCGCAGPYSENDHPSWGTKATSEAPGETSESARQNEATRH